MGLAQTAEPLDSALADFGWLVRQMQLERLRHRDSMNG